jgi:hypothetical protein
MLGLGVTLHVMIEYSILVGFFSLAILTAYVTFVPPETLTHHLLILRDHFKRKPVRTAGRLVNAAPPTPSPSTRPPDSDSTSVPVDHR